MKRIITALVLILASITAKAQYVDKPIDPSTVYRQTVQSLYSIPEYKDAVNKEQKGKTMFFTGLGTQLVGIGLTCVPSVKHTSINEDGYSMESLEVNYLGVACNTIGAITAITGSVFEIIGICKWTSGANEKKNILLMCSAGRIVVTF